MADELPRDGGKRKARLADVARRQWGNVTRRQLEAIGFSTREVDGMVGRGEIYRLHRGVYAVGHVSPAPEAKWAAALLAAGGGAALSHTTVLAVHGLIKPRHLTEITAPTQRRGDDALRIHTAELRGESEHVSGLHVTTLPRAFLDLAAAHWPIDRFVHEAAAAGLCSLETQRAFALAAMGRPGAPAYRRALALPHLRSKREAALHAALREAGIAHEMNAPVGKMHVDALAGTLALELDHENTHGAAWVIARDARRDAELERRGLQVVRSTEIDVLVRAARAAGP